MLVLVYQWLLRRLPFNAYTEPEISKSMQFVDMVLTVRDGMVWSSEVTHYVYALHRYCKSTFM